MKTVLSNRIGRRNPNWLGGKNNIGSRAWANKCVNRLRRLYNPLDIAPEELVGAYKIHGGKCDICGISAEEYGQALHVDHDHSTGKFRGFLCGRCNPLLGYAKDSTDVLRRAILYLEPLAKVIGI